VVSEFLTERLELLPNRQVAVNTTVGLVQYVLLKRLADAIGR
jgi:hypothetical protein